MQRRSILLSGLLLIAGLTVLFNFSIGKAPSYFTVLQPDPSVPPNLTSVSHPSRTELLSYSWAVGASSAWSLAAVVAIGDPDSDRTNQQVTKLEGVLQMKVDRVRFEQVELSVVMTQARVYGGLAPDMLAALFNSVPCRLTLTTNGQVLSMAFPEHIAPADRRTLALAYAWEVLAKPEEQWEAVDWSPDDGGGKMIPVRSYYSRTGTRIYKQRVAEPPAEDGGAYQRMLTSQFTAQVSGGLWLDSLKGFEEAEFFVGESSFLKASVWIDIQRLAACPPFPHDVVASAFVVRSGSLTQTSVADQIRLDALQEKWGSVPLDALLSRLGELTSDGGNFPPMERLAPLLTQIREWVEVHGPGEILQSLSHLNDQIMVGALTHALTTTDTAAARMAHAALLENAGEFPGAAVHQALVGAGQTEAPTPELGKAVMDLVQTAESDPLNVGLMALAQISRYDESARELLRARALQGISSDREMDFVAPHLLALHQARLYDPQALTHARSLLLVPDPYVRRIAAEFIAGSSPEAMLELQQFFANDTDRQLRDALGLD